MAELSKNRQIAELAHEIVSVKDFGAVGDGVTDDTTAIQAAINSNPGVTIFFPAGDYKITSSLTIQTDNTVLMGENSRTSKIKNSQTNGDAIVFSCSTTGQSDYLNGGGIIGLRVQRNTDATSGTALKLVQCNNFMMDDFNNLNHPQGIHIFGGKESHFHNIRQSINGAVITGTPVSNSSLLRISPAPTDGATHQTPFTMQFSDFTFSGGSTKSIDDIIIIECCDGLNFVNGYVNYGNTNLVKIKPSVSGKSVVVCAFSNVYFDGVNETTGTTNGIRLEDDGFAGASTISLVSFDSGCTIGNLTGKGLFADHPQITLFSIDPTRIITTAGAEVDISGAGATSTFIGLEQSWTPELTTDTPTSLSITYSKQIGRYTRTKDGMVHLNFRIETSSLTHSTASGNWKISGIPSQIRAATFTDMQRQGTLLWSGITKANYTQVITQIGSNSNTISLIASGSGQATQSITSDGAGGGDIPSGTNVVLKSTISYPVGEQF